MKNKQYAKEERIRLDLGQAQKGDKKIRQQLVAENMGLVYMVAKRFADRGVELQDLVQIGAIGLIKAIDRFDLTLSFSFSTYAVPLIMGEIRRFLRDDQMIHTSRQIKENARKIAIVREQLKKTQNKEPTLRELSEQTKIAMEDLVVALEAGKEVDSFSRPLSDSDGKQITLEEKLEDSNRFEGPLLEHLALQQGIRQLTPEEEKLIRLRYMENLSQSETARLLGTNQVAVSRRERKILEKLRRKML